jgi:hypothetical protein
MRDHNPVLIEEFNGLWDRGGIDSVPIDHFSDCNNIQFLDSGFKTRDGEDVYKAYPNVVRIHTYIKQDTEALLVLDDAGNIYDTENPIDPTAAILTVSGMTDFSMVSIAGRAFITPHNGISGLSGEYIYVYKGDGTAARKAGGAKPTSAPVAANSATTGDVEAGYHVFAVVYETDTGFLTGLSTGVALNCTGGKKVSLSSIPVSPDSFVVARRIVATTAIDPTLWDGNLEGYQFFFVPDGRIADNTTTTLDVSFFDSVLLDDASHLEDIYEHIPAGVNITTYHGRLVSVCEHDNISVARVSFAGEPEAVDQVDGIIIVGGVVLPSKSVQNESDPLTNCIEYRDVLYLFKSTKTISATDNGDVPSSWPVQYIDNGQGASIHSITTILDSGGIDIDYLVVGNYTGIMQFNGTYNFPELSWKIRDLWLALDRDNFKSIETVNDTIHQVIYFCLPDGTMLIADYSNGLDSKAIRYSPWSFHFQVTTIALINKDTLILGANQNL